MAAMPGPQAAILLEFAAWVESEALISINVRAFVILELLDGGHYQNIYEWADEQSRLSGRPAEDALRERLGKYYNKRMTLDGAFVDGNKLRYGALNAGGAGLVAYDPYCLVLIRRFHSALSRVAYFPRDSPEVC